MTVDEIFQARMDKNVLLAYLEKTYDGIDERHWQLLAMF